MGEPATPRLGVRPAVEAELDRLYAIVAADAHGSWSRAQLAQELTLTWSRCDVLEEEASGTLLGLMVYWHVADELELLYIATHPQHLRRGYGRRLLSHLMGEARRLGVQQIALEVRAGNEAAISLYRTEGFVPVGVRRGYYQKDGEDALLFRWLREGGDEAGG